MKRTDTGQHTHTTSTYMNYVMGFFIARRKKLPSAPAHSHSYHRPCLCLWRGMAESHFLINASRLSDSGLVSGQARKAYPYPYHPRLSFELQRIISK